MDSLSQDINNLIDHTSALQCSDDQTPTLVEPTSDLPLPPSLTLIGKIISLKPFSKLWVKNNIRQAWQLSKPFITEDKEDNKMVFTFEVKDDLLRVLNNSHWNINGTPLFLKPWENDETFEEVDFTKAAIWVQVHGLPLDRMNATNASIIAESLGGLVQFDNSDNLKPSRKSFLRIRVLLPLNEPLPTSFLLQRASKLPTKIRYQYERLSEFCYACGRLGHLSSNCPIDPRPPISGRYGPNLKASSPHLNRVELLVSSRKPITTLGGYGANSQVLPHSTTELTLTSNASGSTQLNTAHVNSQSMAQHGSSTVTPALNPDSSSSAELKEKAPLVTSHLMLAQVTTLNNFQLNLPNKAWSIS
jgi:hypothetical protein